MPYKVAGVVGSGEVCGIENWITMLFFSFCPFFVLGSDAVAFYFSGDRFSWLLCNS